MDEYDMNKNEVFMYSLSHDVWSNATEKIIGMSIPALSMHTAVSVITGELKNDLNFDI